MGEQEPDKTAFTPELIVGSVGVVLIVLFILVLM
jgi:hypothetical protein